MIHRRDKTYHYIILSKEQQIHVNTTSNAGVSPIIIQADHDRFERVIQHLSEEQQLRPISPEGWSVKDFLAHMAHWNAAAHAVLVAYLHYQPLPEVVPSGDEANAQIREQDSSRSLQEAQQYWQESHSHLLHMLTVSWMIYALLKKSALHGVTIS